VSGRAVAVGRYFDAVAGSYAGRYLDTGPAGHALAIRQQRIFELIGAAEGPALDAGCGPGLLLADLRARGIDAVGVDLSPAMVSQAATRAASLTGSMERLPFADGSFGLVIAAGSVEYVGDDWIALAELSRVLRPGGVLVASFPNRWSPYRLWKNLAFYPLVDRLRPLVFRLRGKPIPPSVTPYHHAYDPAEIRQTLGDFGCEVVDVVFMNMQLVPSPIDEWLPALSVALSRPLERFGRAAFGQLGTAFLVRAVKESSRLTSSRRRRDDRDRRLE
jgi:SAM-dependent methyltransferase